MLPAAAVSGELLVPWGDGPLDAGESAARVEAPVLWVESALWLPEAEPGQGEADADRMALRQVLGAEYDAHARVVSRTLSENPGLRAVAGSVGGLTAGLVAVRAYLRDEREAVNIVLRGGEVDGVGRDRVRLLARSARYGLRRLPSVFGPVYCASAGEPAGYRPGDELVEPGFVDVDLVPPAGGAEGVEFAIWSVSAHRLAGLGGGGTAALFPPGSRFAVLAVDEPEDEESPVRVLLRDLATSRRGRGGPENTERVLARLREANRPSGVIRPPDARTSLPIGLDARGRRFRRPVAAPVPAGRTERRGGAARTQDEGGRA